MSVDYNLPSFTDLKLSQPTKLDRKDFCSYKPHFQEYLIFEVKRIFLQRSPNPIELTSLIPPEAQGLDQKKPVNHCFNNKERKKITLIEGRDQRNNYN